MRSSLVQKRSADDQLMRAFGNGDEAALEELFIRFGPEVYGIGLRRFVEADLADALVERTLVTMWHRSSEYIWGSMPLETWVVSKALAVALQMSASPPGEHAGAGSVRGTKTDGDQPAVA